MRNGFGGISDAVDGIPHRILQERLTCKEQTVAAGVPIGKITSDVFIFKEYGDIITIELEKELLEVEAQGE